MQLSRNANIAALVSVLVCSASVLSFDDPISLIGRVKWNYTNFEESLWKYNVTSLNVTQIYRYHIPFLVQKLGENGFDLGNSTDSVVPFQPEFNNATKKVDEVWELYSNFSRWYLSKRVESEVVSISHETEALEAAMNTLQDDSYRRIYFEFFQFVS